jgi:hypothetical protein
VDVCSVLGMIWRFWRVIKKSVGLNGMKSRENPFGSGSNPVVIDVIEMCRVFWHKFRIAVNTYRSMVQNSPLVCSSAVSGDENREFQIADLTIWNDRFNTFRPCYSCRFVWLHINFP